MPRKRTKGEETEIAITKRCSNGSSVAYGTRDIASHPACMPCGNCWKCGGYLGCRTCTTNNVREVLCRKCAAWGTKEAFQHHGPILNTPEMVLKRHGVRAPEAGQYPEAWWKDYDPPDSTWTMKDLMGVVNSLAKEIRK